MIEYNANHFSNKHDSLENRYSRRRSPRKNIIEFPVQMKAISLGILITTISWIIPPYALQADPLPIPQLNTPQFRSQDLEPAFDAARNATSETGWEQIVAETRALYSASWETAVDAQITAYVSSVNE